jgi:hypothetical protein
MAVKAERRVSSSLHIGVRNMAVKAARSKKGVLKFTYRSIETWQ